MNNELPDAIGLNELTATNHDNAVNHGWWEENRSFGEVIALIHSELSEALEEYRDAKPDFYYLQKEADETIIKTSLEDYRGEKPEGIAVELADAIIRILDYCGHKGIDIEQTIRIKHEYNKSREYKHGGKVI